MKLSRRGFIASAVAAGAVRTVPQIAAKKGWASDLNAGLRQIAWHDARG